MKLEQKKFLKPTFIFEHDSKVLKVTRKNLLSRSSFEVQVPELSPNKIEESRFALGFLVAAILFMVGGIILAYVGVQQGLAVHGGGLYFLSAIAFLLSGLSSYGFNKRTYDYVMLYRKDTGTIAMTFYRSLPSEDRVNEYIADIKRAIEGGHNAGFNP